MSKRNQTEDTKPSLAWLMRDKDFPVTPIDRSNIQPRFNGFIAPRVFRTAVEIEPRQLHLNKLHQLCGRTVDIVRELD